MIYYNSNKISDWNLGDDNIIKVYKDNAVCYYKIVTSGGTTSQTPCYAVVDDISQYSDTEFEDVFNNADGKWYKLNNLDQYEEYGLYGNNITSETTYQGKLSIYDGYEYMYSGSSWTSVGEVSGSTRLPQGYTEVEYLENIQGRYAMIDTGFKPNQDTRVVCEMQNVTSQLYSRYIGAGHWNWTNGDIGWQFDYENNYNGTLHISWGSIKGWKTYSVTGDYLKHKYDWNKNEFYRDDVLVASVSYTNFQCGSNLGIFNKISSGESMQNNEALWGKLYSFQLYDNGTLIRDLVPCKRDYDNMYGAYDIVNDQFYYSNTISGYTNNTFYEFSGGSATTQVTYPLYYTEKSDPPSSVSFSSMTEAEEYECPYVGLDATIVDTDYIFDENYDWVTKYGIFEVSGEYLCYGGDKYKKMEEKVRNVDDSWSSQDPPVYEKGDLIESGSTDCSCYILSPEYIERTASANGYVGLGEYFQENTKIEIDFQMTQAKGFAIIGDYLQNDNDDWRVFLNFDSQINNLMNYDFLTTRINKNIGNWSNRFHLEIGNYYIKDLDSGSNVVSGTPKSNFTRPNQMYIFHLDGTTSQQNTDYGKVYSLKIWQGDTLAKDFIPWTDGNDNYGLYDKVSKSVFSSTTQMTGSSSVTSVNTCCRLPEGYTEVEYIRNSGYNAYINTGVIIFDNTTNTYTITTRLTSEFHSNLGCATIIACENPISTPYYYGLGYRYKCSQTVDQFEFYGSYPNYSSSTVDNGDGTRTITFQSTGNTSWTLNTPLIFFANWANTSYDSINRPSDATIYSSTIVKNGITVRDFVPAKRDSDSVYGLYDLINDEFYVSPNGNNFTGGDVVCTS